jgi:hypothetical protein
MVDTENISKDALRHLIAEHTGSGHVPDTLNIITDTSDFFRVGYNDVLVLAENFYLIKNYEKEGRFGLDDEPKYWVRRAIDLSDGSSKIIKMVFHEEFETRVGGVVIKCFRSPKKEARILDLVAAHKNFMHGYWINDTAGNNVRIIDYIPGRRFDDIIVTYGSSHEDYFFNHFPAVLDQYIELVEAIKFLHDNGEKHGDIRRDHIIFDKKLNVNRWIDFDYNYMHGESMWSFDLQGLGNIIIFLAGRGDVLVQDLYDNQRELFDSLWGEDLNISYKNRVANLRKIYPYLPESLNRILLHFSVGAQIFYETTGQMLDDLAEARADLT